MMAKKVKVAFIGCGSIHWPHLNGYLDLPEKVEVVACCDNIKASAEASAARRGEPKSTQTGRKCWQLRISMLWISASHITCIARQFSMPHD
ncbi:MAG: hypothetical protein UZ16_OP3001001142 [Candidatus Hinthialibacteria bacterium OLB16]|nr:MAG: hypothetical protein UZ16_OP3001001142 [Candidatus Hinthialibacteria bacterium OLB16]